MIICQSCKFVVPDKMKHSIDTNSCPCCGTTLLSSSEVNKITSISSKIREQGFSDLMEQSLISNIAFFIYFNFIKDFEKGEKASPEDYDAGEKDDSIDLKALRIEVEEEMVGDRFSNATDSSQGEDKVSRLKDIAKNQKSLSKSQLRVKRLSV